MASKITNKEFANNDAHFENCCKSAGIPATRRQASKFRMGKGLAFKHARKRVS